MKEIIVVGVCLLLIGGLIMPATANETRVDIAPQLPSCVLDIQTTPQNATILYNRDFINAGNYTVPQKTGKKVKINIPDIRENTPGFSYESHKPLQPPNPFIIYLEKEGYETEKIEIFNINVNKTYKFNITLKPFPTPTPEPPEVTPQPTISQDQRISELENTTEKHETRISWLENKVNGMLSWIRSKFGDII